MYVCNICRERLFNTPYYRITNRVKVCEDCQETRMVDLDRWLLEEEAQEMNAAFDRKREESDQL